MTALDAVLTGLNPLEVLGLVCLIAAFLVGIWIVVDGAISYAQCRLVRPAHPTTTSVEAAVRVPHAGWDRPLGPDASPASEADVRSRRGAASTLPRRDQANAVALAPAWWKRCWHAEHRVAIRQVSRHRIVFACDDCDRSTWALHGRAATVVIGIEPAPEISDAS